jgi:integrase
MEGMWDGRKRFRLGATLPDAYRTFAARTEASDTPRKTIGALLDRYQLEVLPVKAPKTRYDQVRQIPRLRGVFGDMPLDALLPLHVYKYADKRGAPTAAKREVEILSHAFTMAVKWGDIARHPFRGEVRLDGSDPRDRYVEDWEIVECLQLSSKRRKGSILAVQAHIRLKLLTGMSRGDLLRLRPATQHKDDGIHVQRNKTKKSSGKRTIYEWTEELRNAVQIALEARPTAHAEHLFCNRDGEGYVDEDTGTAKGWDSLWQGFMDRVLKETKVTQRFTEHDLRAKVASDAESLDRARALLAHVDARLTERFYRRKPERVRPMK